MHKYIIRRLLISIPTLFVVSLIIFFALRLLPGDATSLVLGGEQGIRHITDEQREYFEDQFGLNDPMPVQYGRWMYDVFTLELGENFWDGIKVMDIIKRRGPITFEIAILAIIISWIVGVPVGILSAMKQNSVIDFVARFFTILFIAIPSFWLASLLYLWFLLAFDYSSPPAVIHFWDDPKGNLEIVIWPSLILGMGISSYTARMARSTLLEIIREDYIRTARAKGLKEQMVIFRHALRNALLPVITWSGVLFGIFLGGSVAVERVFQIPGLGTTLVDAFNSRDLMMIQNLVLLYGFTFVMVNLTIDLLYAWVDPRIRYS